jgi:flavodoxin
MVIDIIFHSLTGNTQSVIQRLEDRLLQDGHTVRSIKLEVTGDVHPKIKHVFFKSIPQHEDCDLVLLGSPVQDFALSTVMMQYLKQTPRFSGKPVLLLMTHYFPRPWLGGKQGIREMAQLVTAKGGKVIGSKIIDWGRQNREQQIVLAIEQMAQMIKAI